WQTAQFVGNVQSVGDHGEGAQMQTRDLFGDFARGGAGVKSDGVAIVDQLHGGGGDAELFGVVQRLLELKRVIAARVHVLERPPVGADESPLASEIIQVSSGRNARDAKSLQEIGNGDALAML